MKLLQKVLTLLAISGLTLKLKNWKFFADNSDYLGYVIRPGKRGVTSNTTDAIGGMKYHTTISLLRSFLGLCNVLRRLVPNYGIISTQFNAKFRKDQTTKFDALSKKQKESMTELQNVLILPPVLALSWQEILYKIYTDAWYQQNVVHFRIIRRKDRWN